MDLTTDAIVIGAGVVGLAVARALARSGVETVILERRRGIGEETSSRNSEVIHAGIYYPPGSLKAETCVNGKERLYDFLSAHQVPHRRCGKLVVARDAAQQDALARILERASLCGVTDLELIGGGDLHKLEPEVQGELALLSPSTGIVDSHQFMLALLADFESSQGVIALDSPVESGALMVRGKHHLMTGGDTPTAISCRLLVNATGLYARDTWDRLVGEELRERAPPQYYARGHYFSYTGAAPFSRLVYPVPEPGGLGVHATLDMGGQVRFGPDVQWIDSIDYRFDDTRRDEFLRAIRDYFPAVDASRLQPGYTGIRPKVVGPGEAAGDFTILCAEHHGIRGFCSLHGIESPGLTAAMSIAQRVVKALLTA